MKLKHLTILLLFYSLPLLAQQNYLPLNSVYQGEELIYKIDAKLVEDIARIDADDAKAVAAVYQQRAESIKENIAQQHYLFDTPINDYLEAILSEIIAANPEIPAAEINLFISRYAAPNASCLGEGSIVFNIGLIRRLENKDQIAFILCHELAHYTANHVNNNIKKNIQTFNAIQSNKRVNRLRKQKFNQREKLLEILAGLRYERSRHSRVHETDADAIGMSYYLNTSFRPEEALRCMLLLDTLDQDKYTELPNLKKWFDFPDYPFKTRWLLAKKRGLSRMKVQIDTALIDSLKTHPDCQLRHQLLRQQINGVSTSPTSHKEETHFKDIIRLADFELVESFFNLENYGRSLFHALQLLEKYPDNLYLRSRIGFSLYEIYQAQATHQLNQHVEAVKKQKENYKQVLRFIHNLRLVELEAVTYYFLKNEDYASSLHEDYLFARWLSIDESEQPEEAEALKEYYLKNFPQGIYLSDFKE